MNIGYCFVTIVELWGLYQGLIMAWNHGVRYLNVKIDRLCVKQLVDNPMVKVNELYPLVSSTKEITTRDWNITINHIYREANFVVDFLASYASSLPSYFLQFPG